MPTQTRASMTSFNASSKRSKVRCVGGDNGNLLVIVRSPSAATTIASRASSARTRSTCTRPSWRGLCAVERAMEICGGASFFRSRGIERIFRDIQAVRFDPWDERRQYVFSGRVALGLDPV